MPVGVAFPLGTGKARGVMAQPAVPQQGHQSSSSSLEEKAALSGCSLQLSVSTHPHSLSHPCAPHPPWDEHSSTHSCSHPATTVRKRQVSAGKCHRGTGPKSCWAPTEGRGRAELGNCWKPSATATMVALQDLYQAPAHDPPWGCGHTGSYQPGVPHDKLPAIPFQHLT